MSNYCRRYMDDAPGIRGDCAVHLKAGRRCEDCQHRNIRAELAALRERVAEAERIILGLVEEKNPVTLIFERHPAARKWLSQGAGSGPTTCSHGLSISVTQEMIDAGESAADHPGRWCMNCGALLSAGGGL